MSERGSFVTEYMYCEGCLEKMKRVLLKDSKYLKGVQIEGWLSGLEYESWWRKLLRVRRRVKALPIIAGKVGGLYLGDEIDMFMNGLFDEENAPCHPVRISVITDGGRLFVSLLVTTSGEVKII